MVGRDRRLDPFVPTPNDVVERIIELAELSEDRVLIDLGSGDGRIPIAASLETGCIGLGVEINKELVRIASQKARESSARVLIINEDLRRIDLGAVDVVTAYLTRKALAAVKPLLGTLRRDAVVITHDYPIPGWRPVEVYEFWSSSDARIHRLFKYRPESTSLTRVNRRDLMRLDEIVARLRNDY
jgi:hypothetical protein